jgi:hypothetical protein
VFFIFGRNFANWQQKKAQYDLYKGFFWPYFLEKRKKQQSPDLDSESM